MHRFISLCIAISWVWVATAGADQVVLTNGNTLSGSIVKLVDGELEFKPDLASVVTLNVSAIDTLSTDGPVVLELNDGTTVDTSDIVAFGATDTD